MFAYFKSILEQDAAPIVICDLDSVIRYMNPAAVAEYHADLTGKNLSIQCRPKCGRGIQLYLPLEP